MTALVVFGVAAALGIAAFVLALSGSTRAEKRDRGAMFVTGMMFFVAISAWILAWLPDHALPVARPAEPWHDTSGCHDDSKVNLPLFVLVYGIIRLGPAPWMALIGRRTVDPRRVFRFSVIALAIVGALATVRVVMGGDDPGRFTTYGALTPEHAGGWRADLLLATLGAKHDVPEADPIDHEIDWHTGGDNSYQSAREGLQAWVGDEPVLFYWASDRLVGASVEHRDPEMIPPERRAHFAEWPRVADDGPHGRAVLFGRGQDGGLLAVQIAARDASAEEVTEGDACIFVAPPWTPWLVAAALALLGVVAVRYYQARLLASWLFLEATVALLYAYTRFVCGS